MEYIKQIYIYIKINKHSDAQSLGARSLWQLKFIWGT